MADPPADTNDPCDPNSAAFDAIAYRAKFGAAASNALRSQRRQAEDLARCRSALPFQQSTRPAPTSDPMQMSHEELQRLRRTRR